LAGDRVGKQRSSLGRFARSFAKAVGGIALMLREPNARIHVAALLTVAAFAFLGDLPPADWSVLVLTVGLVLALETLNTALEGYVDLAAPGRNDMAARAKDAGAGAVLIAAVASVVVAALVFIPRFDAVLAGLGAAWLENRAVVLAYAAVTLGLLLSGILYRDKWPS